MKKKYSKVSRKIPKDRTKQALKVLRAHNKYGDQTLSPEQIDDIPGLETLGGKKPGL
jgi:hypothetical protein